MAPERLVAALAAAALLSACGSSPGGNPTPDGARAAFAGLRYDDGPPPADPSDRVADDERASVFGQKIFFDPFLSGPLIEGDNDGTGGTLGVKGDPGKVACSSCHVPASGFVDTRSPHRQISLAAQWTARRTPELLEVAFAPLYNWDGRRDAIWNQAIGVMESDREFNSGRLFVAEQVFRERRADYEALFGAMPPLDDDARFPQLSPGEAGCTEVLTRSGSTFSCRGKPGDGADYDGMAAPDQHAVTVVTVNVAKSVEAYVRKLRCGPGRFDRWLDGDDTALTESERRGADLFVGRAKCVSCHAGPSFTDGKFHNVGLAPAVVAVAFVDEGDTGAYDGVKAALADPLSTAGEFSDGDRHALPSAPEDTLLGAFRTPSLRCASEHPSYMHTGQIRTLSLAVEFHDRGGDAPGSYPGTNELSPLGLTEEERADLVAFLGTLQGVGPPAELLAAP
ncbi:MAG TPA: cytochrome c peroxidase [Polyangiaceae bacterium]|nr:cytochrome c peroxidase [Polyangiaceae bacterium]